MMRASMLRAAVLCAGFAAIAASNLRRLPYGRRLGAPIVSRGLQSAPTSAPTAAPDVAPRMCRFDATLYWRNDDVVIPPDDVNATAAYISALRSSVTESLPSQLCEEAVTDAGVATWTETAGYVAGLTLSMLTDSSLRDEKQACLSMGNDLVEAVFSSTALLDVFDATLFDASLPPLGVFAPEAMNTGKWFCTCDPVVETAEVPQCMMSREAGNGEGSGGNGGGERSGLPLIVGLVVGITLSVAGVGYSVRTFSEKKGQGGVALPNGVRTISLRDSRRRSRVLQAKNMLRFQERRAASPPPFRRASFIAAAGENAPKRPAPTEEQFEQSRQKGTGLL